MTMPVSCASDSNVLRVEALPGERFEYNSSFTTVTEFYGRTETRSESVVLEPGKAEGKEALELNEFSTACVVFPPALQVAINLPPTCLSCLGALIHYLKPFNLQRILSLTK